MVVVEPRAKIGPFKNSQDTSHLRNLVSAALLSETENPITVVCRYVNDILNIVAYYYYLLLIIIFLNAANMYL